MKASDWTCPDCGRPRIKTSSLYLCCEGGCGRLVRAPWLGRLLIAKRNDYKRFTFYGERGFFERIPGQSGDYLLDSRPPVGVLIARAPSGRVCAFREAKPPRKKKAGAA